VNQGLVLLAAWAQWLLAVGLLVAAVVRRVEHVHDRDPKVVYRRRDGEGGAVDRR
jgi:hypothetical protein